MLDKVEFSDLYKFLTSVGLIFIASAFLLPWLFMKDGIGILVSEEEYSALIETSKNLTDKRIALSSFVITSIPWISSLLFIVGSFLVSYGLFYWKKKQKRVDETEELNLLELRLKIKKLNSSEIKDKAENEIEEEISAQSDIVENEASPQPEVTKSDMELMKGNLIDIENLFYEKIVEFNSFDFKVNSNVKIVGGREVDILLNAYNIKKKPDILIDIKYLQNKLSMQLIRDAYQRFKQIHNSYVGNTKRNAKMKFVIVYKHDIAKPDQINRFINACKELERESNYPALNFFVMDEIQAKDFDIQQFLK